MNKISKAAAALGRKGGSVKSERKAKSSAENGKKGGRPKNYQVYVQYDYPGHERGSVVSEHATYDLARAASKKTGNDDKHIIRDKRDYGRQPTGRGRYPALVKHYSIFKDPNILKL